MRKLDDSLVKFYREKKPLYTNYFSQLDSEVFIKELANTLLIIKPQDCFFKLYFLSSDLDEFDKSLQNLEFDNLCLEFIQRGELELDLKTILEKHFIFHTLYEKLTINTKDLKLKTKPDLRKIQYAQIQDLEFLHNSLHQNFDARFDHTPSKEALLELIKNHQVIIKEMDKKILAYCIYTIQGKTSHFNYLLNIQADPLMLIDLIEQYYQDIKQKGIDYIYLWVDILKNIRVKNMHLKYGYKSSQIFNHTFIKSNKRNALWNQ